MKYASESILSIMDVASGTYRVVTEASTYFVSLDVHLFRRAPNASGQEVATLRRDGEWIVFLAIVECTVGRRMDMIIDLGIEDIPFTFRRSMPVVSIDLVEGSRD